MGKNIVVRFAPSPTGYFHIGSARTALFNYLFTRKNRGKLILRIEDTDKERSSLEYEKDIIESLKWLGIKWDKGPIRQSERKEIYKKHLKKLIEENKAYYCFCPKEELEAKRQEQISRGQAPKYNGKCASLSKEEVENNLREGKDYVVRFKTPVKKIKFNDLVRGEIEFDGGLVGDFTIAKDLDNPLYNFTVVVDDYEMKISHVIRGEDLLPNTPKQIFLEDALGFNHVEYVHLPLILGPDKSKLSKRHGATSVNEYKKTGYLPEAIVNFLGFLGWNPNTEKEIYSLSSLIKEFSVDNIQKSAAVFNIERLNYLNGFYIRKKPIKELVKLCIPYLLEAGLISLSEKKYVITDTNEEVSIKYLEKVVSLYQERIKKLSEIGELTDYFFKGKIEYERDLLKWKNADTKDAIDKIYNILSGIKEWKNLEKALMPEAEKFNSDRGFMLWPFRVALTGRKSSASPFDIALVLGKEKTLKRIKYALDKCI